jgi:hypothetical protein
MADFVKKSKKYKQPDLSSIVDFDTAVDVAKDLEKEVANVTNFELADLEKLGSDLSNLRDSLLAVVKSAQGQVQAEIAVRQGEELQARKNADPEYDAKAQGVGLG